MSRSAAARSTPAPAPPAGRARESFADEREIDAFVETLGRFERGEIDAEQWRAFRVVHGAYAQRQDGVHMLRIKIPQGLATAAQLRALAEVAARWSRGFGHVTTRQDLQLHFVRPADLEPALRRLAAEGITTFGAGGNAVRNVVACPHAGVSPDEAFDPTPYAEAVSRHFLRHPLSASLPRKLKIGFEGCRTDHARTAIQDLGFTAVVGGPGAARRGFAVTVAGGTASSCTAGSRLLDFLPAADVLVLAEAVVRVFHARGDRRNKQRNRLKFLVKDLGLEPFRALVDAAVAEVRAEGPPALPFDPERPPEEEAPRHERPQPPSPREIAARVAAAPPCGPGEPPPVSIDLAPSAAALALFRTTNVAAQRQAGFSVVSVSPPQGDVTAAQLEVLADLSLACGDGTVRLASTGRLDLRWVADRDVPALHARLAAAGLARDGAGSAADVIACPGADACRTAITRTHGVARLAGERVRERLGAAALAVPLPVHASGCPNGCSQHHLAAIGLQGSARKLGGRSVPQYFVLLGGGVSPQGPFPGSGEGGVRFGKLAAKIPAGRVPEALERLAGLYLAERRPGEDAGAFFAREHARAAKLISPLEELRLGDARPEDFREPGSTEPFQPDSQEGECAA